MRQFQQGSRLRTIAKGETHGTEDKSEREGDRERTINVAELRETDTQRVAGLLFTGVAMSGCRAISQHRQLGRLRVTR